MVINNKGDYELIFSIKQPVEAQIECKLNILYDTDFDVKAEVEEKCEKDNVIQPYHTSYRRNWVNNGNQMSLLTKEEDTYYSYDKDIEEWNAGFKKAEVDVDVDENGPYITNTMEDGDLFSEKVDQATYAIDAALMKFENGELIPDEVISLIEKLNGTLEKDGVTFMIPMTCGWTPKRSIRP